MEMLKLKIRLRIMKFFQKKLLILETKKIITQGETVSNIYSKYNIKSKNVIYLEKDQILSSDYKTIIRSEVNVI